MSSNDGVMIERGIVIVCADGRFFFFNSCSEVGCIVHIVRFCYLIIDMKVASFSAFP